MAATLILSAVAQDRLSPSRANVLYVLRETAQSGARSYVCRLATIDTVDGNVPVGLGAVASTPLPKEQKFGPFRRLNIFGADQINPILVLDTISHWESKTTSKVVPHPDTFIQQTDDDLGGLGPGIRVRAALRIPLMDSNDCAVFCQLHLTRKSLDFDGEPKFSLFAFFVRVDPWPETEQSAPAWPFETALTLEEIARDTDDSSKSRVGPRNVSPLSALSPKIQANSETNGEFCPPLLKKLGRDDPIKVPNGPDKKWDHYLHFRLHALETPGAGAGKPPINRYILSTQSFYRGEPRSKTIGIGPFPDKSASLPQPGASDPPRPDRLWFKIAERKPLVGMVPPKEPVARAWFRQPKEWWTDQTYGKQATFRIDSAKDRYEAHWVGGIDGLGVDDFDGLCNWLRATHSSPHCGRSRAPRACHSCPRSGPQTGSQFRLRHQGARGPRFRPALAPITRSGLSRRTTHTNPSRIRTTHIRCA